MSHDPDSTLLEDRLFLSYRETGDERAFTRLTLLVEPWILRIIMRYVKDTAPSHDVLQNAWLNVLRAKHRFDPSHGSFRAWFYRVAVNAAMQALKTDGRTQPLPRDEDGVLIEPPSPEVAEILTHIPEGLQRLRPGYREVIDLHYYGGFEVREVASIMRIPEGTVKTWLRRGRGDLGKFLSVLGPIVAFLNAVHTAGQWP